MQVHQASLTKMDAMARESANAARTAFGADYEARLRSEAGSKPDKTSRRKHQISSLYHAAKLKVGLLGPHTVPANVSASKDHGCIMEQ